MEEDLRDLARLQLCAAALQRLMTDFQHAAPDRSQGTDNRGAVQAVLGHDGLPEVIRVDARWKDKLAGASFGAAVASACQDARRRRGAAWSQALEGSGWPQRLGRLTAEPAGTADPGPLPPAFRHAGRAVRPRPLGLLAEEAIRALDALTDPAALMQATGAQAQPPCGTARHPSGGLTVSLGPVPATGALDSPPTGGIRMALFDHTAERLAKGPTLALAADHADAVAGLLRRYDPAVRIRGDHFVFGHGVLLYEPIEITLKLAAQGGLPAGTASAYYGSILPAAKRQRRPEDVTRLDAERLVRGLAARLGGTVHGSRPSTVINMRASVYSPQPLPAEDVIGVLQPYASGRLFIEDNPDVPMSYFLLTAESPRFFTAYWPPRLSHSTLQPPAPAIGTLRDQEPCRWELSTRHDAATANAEIALAVGRAALDLGRRTDGIVIDSYGFPLTGPRTCCPVATEEGFPRGSLTSDPRGARRAAARPRGAASHRAAWTRARRRP